MTVVRAPGAGFCMGVSLALKKLDMALEAHLPRRICTLGPIIHNPQVLAHFASRGVVQLNSPKEALPGDFVLIRAHGITRAAEQGLRASCEIVSDATCPRVKKAQLAIANATAAGENLLLFGEAEHPEVRGLVSYAAGKAQVFGSTEELEQLELSPAQPWVLASQTTQDRETFETIAARLGRALPRLNVLSTICDATRDRQRETTELARQVDTMVIVGGKNSGNTRRLADLSRQSGIDTWHIEAPDELRREWFSGKSRIGLTAGASTPGMLIDSVENWLKNVV